MFILGSYSTYHFICLYYLIYTDIVVLQHIFMIDFANSIIIFKYFDCNKKHINRGKNYFRSEIRTRNYIMLSVWNICKIIFLKMYERKVNLIFINPKPFHLLFLKINYIFFERYLNKLLNELIYCSIWDNMHFYRAFNII